MGMSSRPMLARSMMTPPPRIITGLFMQRPGIFGFQIFLRGTHCTVNKTTDKEPNKTMPAIKKYIPIARALFRWGLKTRRYSNKIVILPAGSATPNHIRVQLIHLTLLIGEKVFPTEGPYVCDVLSILRGNVPHMSATMVVEYHIDKRSVYTKRNLSQESKRYTSRYQ